MIIVIIMDNIFKLEYIEDYIINKNELDIIHLINIWRTLT